MRAGPINSGVHVVAPGETLTKIAHQYGKSVAEIAKANNILPYSQGQHRRPHHHSGRPHQQRQARSRAGGRAGQAGRQQGRRQRCAGAKRQHGDAGGRNARHRDHGQSDAPRRHAGFRWPVRGRIIAGFGPKPNGQQNDGIDVAVPENTPIKAAEDGVVAYAGNELKGYGNLVLVRHPNGYVTAYAHAKELLVKRGDQIKRGEVIAKSGQSGNVDAPQLHFEVRKGSAPVDPMQFLNGA